MAEPWVRLCHSNLAVLFVHGALRVVNHNSFLNFLSLLRIVNYTVFKFLKSLTSMTLFPFKRLPVKMSLKPNLVFLMQRLLKGKAYLLILKGALFSL